MTSRLGTGKRLTLFYSVVPCVFRSISFWRRLEDLDDSGTFYWKYFLRGIFLVYFQYFIQQCFICPLLGSTVSVSEDAGIEPSTVATTPLAVRRSNHSAKAHPLEVELQSGATFLCVYFFINLIQPQTTSPMRLFSISFEMKYLNIPQFVI